MKAKVEKKQFSIRPSGEVHERLTEAAAWLGQTLNAFVLRAAAKEADEILETRDKIRLSEKDARMVLELLDSPLEPNSAMKEAVRLHRETIGEEAV